MQSLSRVAHIAILACFSLLFVKQTNGVNALISESGLSNYSFPDNFMFGVATAALQVEGAWNEDGFIKHMQKPPPPLSQYTSTTYVQYHKLNNRFAPQPKHPQEIDSTTKIAKLVIGGGGGKGESMWDTYLHKHPNFTVDGSNGDIAADSYHKYKQDIIAVQSLGVKYYRISISWPRILPNGTDNYINKAGVRHYRKIFLEMIKAKLIPVVTIFHWDMPTPLMDMGGWSNPKIVDYYEDYARVVFRLFGDIVKIWTTVNEVHIQCYNGYDLKTFVPALDSHGVGAYLCSHYMLLGHARAYRLYEREFKHKQRGKVGITFDAFYAEPKDSNKKEDVEAAERYLQMRLGIYAHPIYSEQGDYPPFVRERIDNMSRLQGYPRSRLPVFTPDEVKMIRGSSDFFGLNHYTTFLTTPSSMEPSWMVPSMDHDTGVKMEQDPKWPIPGASWLAVYPTGFRKLLNWITKNYGTRVPIVVTENGVSDFGGLNDYIRVSYYNKYLYQLLLAIHEDGCRVEGYFAWTLLDDFEWSDGYTIKFGLYHVDFKSPDKTRTPKLSALNYREIMRTRRINFNYIKIPTYKYNDL